MRIVLSYFYLLIFYFEKFWTWIWRLPFAVYVMLKLSNMSNEDVGQWTSIHIPRWIGALFLINVHKVTRGASFLKLCVMSLSVIQGKLWRVEDEMVYKVGNLRRDTKQTRRQQLRTSWFVFSDLQVKKTLCATFELWIKEWYHSDVELSSERRIDR